MPAAWAASATAAGPTRASSCAYTVLTDCLVASATVSSPNPLPP